MEAKLEGWIEVVEERVEVIGEAVAAARLADSLKQAPLKSWQSIKPLAIGTGLNSPMMSRGKGDQSSFFPALVLDRPNWRRPRGQGSGSGGSGAPLCSCLTMPLAMLILLPWSTWPTPTLSVSTSASVTPLPKQQLQSSSSSRERSPIMTAMAITEIALESTTVETTATSSMAAASGTNNTDNHYNFVYHDDNQSANQSNSSQSSIHSGASKFGGGPKGRQRPHRGSRHGSSSVANGRKCLRAGEKWGPKRDMCSVAANVASHKQVNSSSSTKATSLSLLQLPQGSDWLSRAQVPPDGSRLQLGRGDSDVGGSNVAEPRISRRRRSVRPRDKLNVPRRHQPRRGVQLEGLRRRQLVLATMQRRQKGAPLSELEGEEEESGSVELELDTRHSLPSTGRHSSNEQADGDDDRFHQAQTRSVYDAQKLNELIEDEDDDLFLVRGSRQVAGISGFNQRRMLREAAALAIGGNEDSNNKRGGGDIDGLVQTIYFGGFFPWLTEEDARVATSLPLKRTQRSSSDNINNASSSYASSLDENRHQLGRFILPAVRLALDHINTNSSVLSSYRLEIVPRDTQCNATISLKEFFDMVYEEPKKMLLYGDACRVSTDPIAKASYFFDLIQISYADTDPIYTIENYPNFFRVVPSENALSLARIPFIRHFNWTRVGTIYQNLPRYSLPHSKLLTDLERYSILIKQSVSLPGSVDGLQNRDLGDELRKLKEKDVRIILGNFDEEWALLLFCEAFRERMTGRKYQWILTGVSEDKLWQYYKRKGSSCSEQELLIAMDGYIITDITPVTRSQQPTISGMMAHEYSNEYRHRAQEMRIDIEENKFYGYVYDGIWAIALALHRVDYQLKYYNWLVETGNGKMKPEYEGITSLLDFDYHKPIWVKLIRNALNKTRFNGVTGTVSFHKNERPGLISFSQFQAFRDMNEVIIGSYDALNDNLDLKVGFPIFWRGSSPPIDYTIQRVTPFRINRTIFVIISILALFGIVLAFVFLTINIKYRNQRYIKMSSPYLNNLIIIGCILTYTSVIILGLDSGLTSEHNFPYICNARAWVLMAGFTLAFGSMFSKTFRVHSIFTNIKLHKKVIKDYKLFMVVFILLTLDVCILIVWQYFDPFYRETNNGTSIQDSDNEDVIIVPEMEHCQSKRMTIFLSVIYVYKGLLMAFGCFLAWETRHVSIPALNDSKYIGLSVYNVVIMCVIGASLSFVLRDQQDASFVIISIFIIFCSTTTLCLVFVPKLIELKQNPRAGDHRVRATLKTFKKNYHEEAIGSAAYRDVHGNVIGRGYGVSLSERIKILLDENVKQRSSLKEKTYELEALTYKYRKIQTLVQSGQFLQVVNTRGGTPSPSSMGPLHSSAVISNNSPTTALMTTRSPTQERVSFSVTKEEGLNKTHLTTPTGTQVDKVGLVRVPFMSSATQITTTNTTSSTNNTTDLTADYSSSKITNTTASSTNINSKSEGKYVSLTRDSLQNITLQKQTPSSTKLQRPVTANYEQNLINHSTRFAKLPLKKHAANYRSNKQSPERVVDSFYCSLNPEYEISESNKFCDDSNLYMVVDSEKKSRRHRRADFRNERDFSRWLEGPFCTLMVRDNDKMQQYSTRDRAHISNVDNSGNTSRVENLRASCPDIASKADNPPNQSERRLLRTIRKQLSQQIDNQREKAQALKRSGLPKTLSMIEYLGLSEFELIANRHDKLVNRRLNKRSSPCCYERISCSYCLARSNQQVGQPGRCLMHSEGDIAFSSSDPINSAELLQSNSRLSCSTCCSLVTPYYVSQSDLFDESSPISESITPQTVSSTTNGSSTHHHHSQTSSNSDSIANQDNHSRVHYCHHHAAVKHQPEHALSAEGLSLASSHESLLSSCLQQPKVVCPQETLEETQIEESSTTGCTQVERFNEEEAQKKLLIKCDVVENL